MRGRCNSPSNRNYSDYGARGITVCPEWSNVEEFCKWALASGYDENLTLDRKDNDGNYTPENCKWSTQKEQQNNRRNNHLITANGESHTIEEWSLITGIQYLTIWQRIFKAGWSPEKAITTPVKKRKPPLI